MERYEDLKSYILTRKIINVHSHQLPAAQLTDVSLRFLLSNSYAYWCMSPLSSGTPAREIPETGGRPKRQNERLARSCPGLPDSPEQVDQWLTKIANRSYYTSLMRGIQGLYHLEEPLSRATWDLYDRVIRNAHKNPDWHLAILKDHCNYSHIVLDSYWNPGDNNGHGELFNPIFRIDPFFHGYSKTARDHNGTNAQILYNKQIDSIDAYVDFLYETIKLKKAAGCCGLKAAIAYDRSLDIAAGIRAADAQKALGYDKTGQSDTDIKMFQDYIFEAICAIAAELEIPLQIHTGLGDLFETNPMRLDRLIKRHPETIFVLMHGGFPWTDDIMALAHNYHNVIIDLCWLPLISPTAAAAALHEALDVCNMNRICWGCDTHMGEESYGALLNFAGILAKTLAERVSAGYMDLKHAFVCVDNIMTANPGYWFNLLG